MGGRGHHQFGIMPGQSELLVFGPTIELGTSQTRGGEEPTRLLAACKHLSEIRNVHLSNVNPEAYLFGSELVNEL